MLHTLVTQLLCQSTLLYYKNQMLQSLPMLKKYYFFRYIRWQIKSGLCVQKLMKDKSLRQVMVYGGSLMIKMIFVMQFVLMKCILKDMHTDLYKS